MLSILLRHLLKWIFFYIEFVDTYWSKNKNHFPRIQFHKTEKGWNVYSINPLELFNKVLDNVAQNSTTNLVIWLKYFSLELF